MNSLDFKHLVHCASFDSFDINYYITENKFSENEISELNGRTFYGIILEKTSVTGGKVLDRVSINGLTESEETALFIVRELYNKNVTTYGFFEVIDQIYSECSADAK